MNTLLKPLAIAALLIAPTFAHAQKWTDEEWKAGVQKEEFARFVKSGSDTKFYFFAAVNPDCSSVDGYEVTVTKSPQHGQVELEPHKDYVQFAKENPRAKCNEKKVEGANWIYRSEKGYRGKDEFEITVYAPNGTMSQRKYIVDVR